ncbi:hypothetical protein L207DRAFT_525176 [Hyaloscypha variabilis F]|uniref:Uncharacterized protein n=1 Tax=Hyaloscypha variabilis (strain UAMH 11265 / GT02V1 / F) TaxID=1149755 RepID=A0A2J6S513_HYAVF|nr:hypothetical protein L207DRAFT_525176 [Hyaloscypha variabilis F]
MACHNQPSGIHRPASLRLADWGCIRKHAFSFLSSEECWLTFFPTGEQGHSLAYGLENLLLPHNSLPRVPNTSLAFPWRWVLCLAAEELEIPTDSSVETMKFFSVIRVPLACDVFLTRCSFVTLPASIFPSSFVDAPRVSIFLRLFVATTLKHLHCATILLPQRTSSLHLASSRCAAFEGVDILCLWSCPCGLTLPSSRNITAHLESVLFRLFRLSKPFRNWQFPRRPRSNPTLLPHQQVLEAPHPLFLFMSFDSQSTTISKALLVISPYQSCRTASHRICDPASFFFSDRSAISTLHPSPSSAESTLLGSRPPPTTGSVSEYRALSLETCSDFVERLSANSFSFRRFGCQMLFELEGWVCVEAANEWNRRRVEEWNRDNDERRSANIRRYGLGVGPRIKE